jgi:hypothetical protein
MAGEQMAGIALNILPVVAELTERASNLFSGLVLGSRQFRDSSMQVMELYVERARLEALGQLIMTKGLKYSDVELRDLVRMLRQLTVEIERSNRLFRKYDLQSDVKVQPVLNRLMWAARDQQRLSDQIQNIHLLVDSLTDLITRVIETDHARVQKKVRHRNKARESSTSVDGEPISTLTFPIFNAWDVAVGILDEAVEKLVRDLDLRRSFAQASTNLKVWGNGFDFKISDIDRVLDDNEDLQEGVLDPLRTLLRMLSTQSPMSHFGFRLPNASI